MVVSRIESDGHQKHAISRTSLIPFVHRGYVAPFEIEDASTVTVLAVRDQREDDYH